jgi:hypothetical protein
MPKYLFIFRESTEKRAQQPADQLQALQTAWYQWMQKHHSAIVVGDGLLRTGRVLKAGLVTDGPYAEAKEIIASFSIIQAADYGAAVAIARECPGDCHGIEIREMGGYA